MRNISLHITVTYWKAIELVDSLGSNKFKYITYIYNGNVRFCIAAVSISHLSLLNKLLKSLIIKK